MKFSEGVFINADKILIEVIVINFNIGAAFCFDFIALENFVAFLKRFPILRVFGCMRSFSLKIINFGFVIG